MKTAVLVFGDYGCCDCFHTLASFTKLRQYQLPLVAKAGEKIAGLPGKDLRPFLWVGVCVLDMAQAPFLLE